MQMEILREYIEFAKYLNFSTAAKKLYISQPSLSNHIAGLEKELGIELVRRSQDIELTAAGKLFFERGCEVMASYEAMLDDVRALASTEHQGSLTIKMAFNDEAGSVRLVEMMGPYKQQHPGVSIKLLKDERNSFVDDILSNSVDCVQMFNYSPDLMEKDFPELECVVIDRVPLGFTACKDHPLMSKERITFEDIQEYPYAMPAGAWFLECVLSAKALYEENGMELKNVHYKAVDSLTDLRFTKIKGDEFVVSCSKPALPKHMAYRIFEPGIYNRVCLVYRKDSENPVLASFIEFVKAQLEEEA